MNLARHLEKDRAEAHKPEPSPAPVSEPEPEAQPAEEPVIEVTPEVVVSEAEAAAEDAEAAETVMPEAAADTAEASGLVSIEDLLKSNPEGAPCTLMRIAEMVQVDEAFLAELEEAAMRPPAAILVRSGDGVVTMETAGSLPVDLPPWIRGQIMVRPEQDA